MFLIYLLLEREKIIYVFFEKLLGNIKILSGLDFKTFLILGFYGCFLCGCFKVLRSHIVLKKKKKRKMWILALRALKASAVGLSSLQS